MKVKRCRAHEYEVGLRFYARSDDGYFITKDKDNKYLCTCNALSGLCTHIMDFVQIEYYSKEVENENMYRLNSAGRR